MSFRIIISQQISEPLVLLGFTSGINYRAEYLISVPIRTPWLIFRVRRENRRGEGYLCYYSMNTFLLFWMGFLPPKLNQAEKQPEAFLPFLEINTSINLLTALN